MGKILCATRGGEASYRTQDAAINLAKEHGDTLVFIYVVDLHFLDKRSGSVIVDVKQEMTNMGEFLLLMAKERAAEQGVVAETHCREGTVREELIRAASEEQVSLVILGRPGNSGSVFQSSGLRALAAEIERETQVPTRIV